ncbi:hypothetical protein [Serratia silvae]|uniref:Rz lytic protein n=1 Tax=Serratia silvae TaxID=2824122 RepID=A0ABT0KH77_9GAMM|nr:hypothetical protein [Serratia silvae]MCL1031391.1 hypothetical protein [Serratia silvae]
MMSPLPLVFSILKIPKIRRAALIGGVALLVVATAWGGYAVIASKFAEQASALEETHGALRNANNRNDALTSALATTAADRDDAENRLVELNKKRGQEAEKLEEFKRENVVLQEKLAQAMVDDPCSIQPLPAAVVRLHHESISAFNAKYRPRQAQQAHSTGGNVPSAGGLDRAVRAVPGTIPAKSNGEPGQDE